MAKGTIATVPNIQNPMVSENVFRSFSRKRCRDNLMRSKLVYTIFIIFAIPKYRYENNTRFKSLICLHFN